MITTEENLDRYIVPIGGIYVTDKPMILQTVLGSCVSVVLYDPYKKIGAMNHIVLPGSFIGNDIFLFLDKKDTKYGIFSLERLIYEMIEKGAKKNDIFARIYGASFIGKKNEIIDIQRSNVNFVKAFLSMSSIPIKEEVTLQNEALKIIFNTASGNVTVIRLKCESQ